MSDLDHPVPVAVKLPEDQRNTLNRPQLNGELAMRDSTRDFRATSRIFLLTLALLFAGSAQAQKAVSFLANVHPDSDQTSFSIKIYDQTTTSPELNLMLRPGGGSVLSVTSMHVLLIDPLSIPDDSDYASIFLGAVTPRGSISRFGAGTISTRGGATAQINFDPGLFVSLDSDETLSLRSQTQSNQIARVEVHGFLESE